MNRKQVLFIVLACLFSIGFWGCSPGSESSAPSLDDKLNAIFEEWKTPDAAGAVIVVVRGDDVVFRRAFGGADPESDDLLNPATTRFDIASIAKTFTAFAVRILEQDGLLDLDADVREYLPWFPDFGVSITARHLLHHTSGLREITLLASLEGEAYLPEDPYLQADIVELLKKQRSLNFPPGTEIIYTNTNYTVLAELVAAVCGVSFQQFMKESVFQPLGMNSTSVVDPENPTTGHIGEAQAAGMISWGESSVITTADDLALFARHLLHPQYKIEATQHLFERGRLDDGEELIYASGLEYGAIGGVETVGHGGTLPGLHISNLQLAPSQNLGVVILGNDGKAVSQMNKVLETLLGENAKPNDERPEIISLFHDAWAGLYISEFDSFELVGGGDKLVYRSGVRRHPIELTDDGRFQMPKSPQFATGYEEDNRIQRIEVKIGLRQVNYHRTPAADPQTLILDDYAGTFRAEEIGSEFTFKINNDGYLDVSDTSKIFERFQPVAEDVFRTDYQKWLFRFLRDESGAVTEMYLNHGRVRNLRFIRIP